jgi:hypothetical protein
MKTSRRTYLAVSPLARFHLNDPYNIYYYRILILSVHVALAKWHKTNRHYDIEEFYNHPGIHYEKIGQLHYSRKMWKLVIRLDLPKINQRYEQVKN